MKTINTMKTLLTIFIILSLSSLVPARERAGRPKPSEKAKAERQKVWSLSAWIYMRRHL